MRTVRWCPRPAFAAAIAVALVRAPRARADEPCARVVTLSGVSPAWALAIESLRRQIALLTASNCQAMTLSLELRDAQMHIVAMTPDGRRTERAARVPDDLVAVAIGLLMAIPDDAAEPAVAPGTRAPPSAPGEAAPPSPPTSPPARAAPLVEKPPAPVPGLAAAEKPPAPIALWAGLSAGVRLTAPTNLSVLDVEARADILLDRWLVLITLRSAVVSCLGQQGVDCDVYNDVSIGAGVGHRFRMGGPDVDVAFEPSLDVMHMEIDGASGAEGQTFTDTEVVLRLDVSARLAVPVAKGWALTLTLDGGLAPSMLASPTRLDVPAGAAADAPPPPSFPAWSGGVRLGVSGALL